MGIAVESPPEPIMTPVSVNEHVVPTAAHDASPTAAGAWSPPARGPRDQRVPPFQEVPSLRRPLDPPPWADLEGPAQRIAVLAESMSQRIRQRPVTSLATALALGFLVGGALSSRAGRVALAAAARRIGHELLKQVL
jgi:hypothetical protein